MILINFRCPTCGKEVEEIFTSKEDYKENYKVPVCNTKDCGTIMTEWNFKNNGQRYFYCDPSK